MKPVIGITTSQCKQSKKNYTMVSSNYVHSVMIAGGIPLLLPTIFNKEVLDGYLDVIDGLLITGGDEDVSPHFYGENPLREVEAICPERDESEFYLYHQAISRNLAIFGICRGMQVMNVAEGGSLYQDVFSQIKDSLGHLPKVIPVDVLYHEVNIEAGSILAGIFETTELMVNSFHHQAVKNLADSFVQTATSSDNLIEAIEHQTHRFAIAVQWHPEDLTVKHPHFIKIFSAFIEAAKNGK